MKKTLAELRDELLKTRTESKDGYAENYADGVLDMYNAVKREWEKPE